MTIEEAISYVQETRKYLTDYSETEQEECDMEISALRAQQDSKVVEIDPIKRLDRSRWEGCGWCIEPCSDAKGYPHWNFEFCPNCGRPLTEESWEELERRINGGSAD